MWVSSGELASFRANVQCCTFVYGFLEDFIRWALFHWHRLRSWICTILTRGYFWISIRVLGNSGQSVQRDW